MHLIDETLKAALSRRMSPGFAFDSASTLPRRIDNAPEKQDRAALPIADGEQEGMVSSEDGNWRLRWPKGCRQIHPHRRGGRRLSPLLVYLYKGLVKDAGDEQSILRRRLVTVDPGEISLRGAERERHAERSELVARVDGSPSGLEPWEEELDLADTHSCHAVVEHLRRERLFEITKLAPPVWKEYQHGQVAAPVDQIHRLVACGLQVLDLFVLAHQRHLHGTAAF